MIQLISSQPFPVAIMNPVSLKLSHGSKGPVLLVCVRSPEACPGPQVSLDLLSLRLCLPHVILVPAQVFPLRNVLAALSFTVPLCPPPHLCSSLHILTAGTLQKLMVINTYRMGGYVSHALNTIRFGEMPETINILPMV